MSAVAIFVLGSIAWYVFCQVMESKSRRIVQPDLNSFPTRMSVLWKWLGPLGVMLICGGYLIWRVVITGIE